MRCRVCGVLTPAPGPIKNAGDRECGQQASQVAVLLSG